MKTNYPLNLNKQIEAVPLVTILQSWSMLKSIRPHVAGMTTEIQWVSTKVTAGLDSYLQRSQANPARNWNSPAQGTAPGSPISWGQDSCHLCDSPVWALLCNLVWPTWPQLSRPSLDPEHDLTLARDFTHEHYLKVVMWPWLSNLFIFHI